MIAIRVPQCLILAVGCVHTSSEHHQYTSYLEPRVDFGCLAFTYRAKLAAAVFTFSVGIIDVRCTV